MTRQRLIPLMASLALWTCAASGMEITNLPSPPMPPQWYQRVSPGITLHCLSPVEYFRGLLGMTPAERNRVLAAKPAAERHAVLAKIAEYEAMPVEVREARLHQTELHWQLMNLMHLRPALRQAQLRLISPLDQPMMISALHDWDQLPEAFRNGLLEKESYVLYYLQWQGSPAGRGRDSLQNFSPERQQKWMEELRRWQALPESQRAEWSGQFRRFFTLSESEQRAALNTLSESERRQMEYTLRTFAQLPAVQRQVCIRSFQKFATMPPEEQDQFLHNAERWQSMSAHEREVWRRLVGRLPPMPPLPPGFQQGLPPMPPGMTLPGGMPPRRPSTTGSASVAAQ